MYLPSGDTLVSSNWYFLLSIIFLGLDLTDSKKYIAVGVGKIILSPLTHSYRDIPCDI